MFSMFQPILGVQGMLKGWHKAGKGTFLMPWLGGHRVPDLQVIHTALETARLRATDCWSLFFCCCSFLMAANKSPKRYNFGWTQQELTALKARVEPYPVTCNYWTPFMPPVHQLHCTEGAQHQYENALICRWPYLEQGAGSRDKSQCRRWNGHSKCRLLAGVAHLQKNPWLGQHPPFHPAHPAVSANTNSMAVKSRSGRKVKEGDGKKTQKSQLLHSVNSYWWLFLLLLIC